MPQPDHVMAFPIPPEAALDDDLKAYYAKCLEKLGLVPNVIRAYSLRPKKLRNFIATYNELMLGDSGLTKLEREMIAVTVSSANRCYYCLVAHGQAVRRLSDDPELGEMLAFNHRVARLPPRQRAMLDFAWTLTTEPHRVGDAERAALHAQGFSDEDIFDICDVVGFFNMSNRVASGVDMMPNPDYHAMNR
ncbi:putative peroxidase-related enzyme [Inquilinus ginsengisoli]|uniref:Peroxidase-related enzyme n=1 Tax=Inquilinus ginsengisoli TaxID=363840 RepID=A0ABU1JX55_9PROT|nr:peroxidase-related enzyme [Inquilinus ginsengisoli]MDR6292159.1 putative peroxidase-related enzyme [Inquilinus ginsengisoli]